MEDERIEEMYVEVTNYLADIVKMLEKQNLLLQEKLR